MMRKNYSKTEYAIIGVATAAFISAISIIIYSVYNFFLAFLFGIIFCALLYFFFLSLGWTVIKINNFLDEKIEKYKKETS